MSSEIDILVQKLRDNCLYALSNTLIDGSRVPKYTDIIIDCLRITRVINKLNNRLTVKNEIVTLERLVAKLVDTVHENLNEDEANLILNIKDAIRGMHP